MGVSRALGQKFLYSAVLVFVDASPFTPLFSSKIQSFLYVGCYRRKFNQGSQIYIGHRFIPLVYFFFRIAFSPEFSNCIKIILVPSTSVQK